MGRWRSSWCLPAGCRSEGEPGLHRLAEVVHTGLVLETEHLHRALEDGEEFPGGVDQPLGEIQQRFQGAERGLYGIASKIRRVQAACEQTARQNGAEKHRCMHGGESLYPGIIVADRHAYQTT